MVTMGEQKFQTAASLLHKLLVMLYNLRYWQHHKINNQNSNNNILILVETAFMLFIIREVTLKTFLFVGWLWNPYLCS